jgi:hypothetical protein
LWNSSYFSFEKDDGSSVTSNRCAGSGGRLMFS